MISLGKNVTHGKLLELKEHSTLLLAPGYISCNILRGNRTHPPQQNHKMDYWRT